MTDYYDHPDNVYINVTDYLIKRIEAHACHSSQYTLDDAKDSADFFTSSKKYDGKNYEKFRYVLVD